MKEVKVKISKIENDAFLTLEHQKNGMLLMVGMVDERKHKLFDEMKKIYAIPETAGTIRINHKKKVMTYYVSEKKK